MESEASSASVMGWKDSIHTVNSNVFFIHWSLSILLKQVTCFIDRKTVAREE